MTRWLQTVDIQSEWQKAKRDEISIEDLVEIIIPKLAAAFCPYQLLEDLKAVIEREDFDEVWEQIYDWADESRVWIKTFA